MNTRYNPEHGALEVFEKRKKESENRKCVQDNLKWYEFEDDPEVKYKTITNNRPKTDKNKKDAKSAQRRNNVEILKDLEMVEVQYEDGKCTMTFLDEERGEIREVHFNKGVFDEASNKFKPDATKAKQCEEWAQEYFNLAFDDISQAVGVKKDIYTYDRFNSLWFVDIIEKFDVSEVGTIFETQIKEIVDDGKAIVIKFEHDEKTYGSKMSYAEYMESKKLWFVNPIKKTKQFAKFESKFHVPFIDSESLIGVNIMVEVKLAFGKFVYNEIKPLPKPKKK